MEGNKKMKQFINDMIHLTEGEKFIKYWYVWLGMIIIYVLISIIRWRMNK